VLCVIWCARAGHCKWSSPSTSRCRIAAGAPGGRRGPRTRQQVAAVGGARQAGHAARVPLQHRPVLPAGLRGVGPGSPGCLPGTGAHLHVTQGEKEEGKSEQQTL